MKEMAQARALLKKFEDQMHKPEGLVHLAEALSLLADVRDSGESDEATKIASNIVIAYAQKVNGVIEGLARERIVHIEIVEHWREVMREFEGSGFTLPPEMATAGHTLLLKKMSPSERQVLLQKLQAIDDGDRGRH